MLENPFNEDYRRGYAEGEKHSVPSRETNNRLKKVEEAVRDLPIKLHDIENSLKVLPEIEKGLKNLDMKSVHWDNTNRIVYGMIVLMLTALIGSLVALVIK